MSPSAGYLLETFVTLVLVLAAAVGVLWAAKRLGVVAKAGPLELVGRLPLDARRAVYLVRIGETVLVVGSSEAGLTKLGELAADAVPKPETAPSKPFADVLARALKKPTEKVES